MTRFITSLSLLVVSALLTPSAIARSYEVNANILIANNYVWRGLTKTKDQPTVQGGIHYQHDIGLYAGLQISNVDFRPGAGRSEKPLYADNENIYTVGYFVQPNNFSFLAGITAYEYPSGGGPRFHEFNGDVGYKGYKLSLNYDSEHENLYTRLSYQADINERISWLAHIGKYSLNDPDALKLKPQPLFNDYTDILIGLRYMMDNEFTWGFNYIDTNLNNNDTDEYGRFTISLETSFNLI